MQTLDMRQIRESSLEQAERLGYPTNLGLPLLDIPKVSRKPSEIVDRILAMHCVAACSYGFSRENARTWYARESHHNSLTGAERKFLETGIGNQGQFIVQIEGIWALAWAISVFNLLDFGQVCSPSFVTMLPDLKAEQGSVSIRDNAVLRPLNMLVGACDLAYCLHWAIRDAEIKGQKVPGKVPEDVIVERRRALEWVISQDTWDEVQLDT